MTDAVNEAKASRVPSQEDVICISDDDSDTSRPQTPVDVEIKEEEEEEALLASLNGPKSAVAPSGRSKRSASSASLTGSEKASNDVDAPSTPVRPPRKRRSGARDDLMKPITPSSTIQSSMNASLVFDMVTSLSTNDPGVAIAALRSVVVLGKEYPSNLLYDELIDRILSVEAVAYPDAVSIYSSLVFVFDKAAACSCDLAFPHQWEPLANALQDASIQPKEDEIWRRNLLVVQFYIYCFKKDFDMCRDRYARSEPGQWIYRTRLFMVLHQGDNSTKKPKVKVHNNLILQAIGCGLQLWQRTFDEPATNKPEGGTTLEAEDACMAVVRLIEMLYVCTDQVQNTLQRVQAGLLELTRETRIKFSQAVQSPDFQVRLATTVMGLTNKSRSKEHEWHECNAMGRLLQTIHHEDNGASSNDVMMTDGYSWSHFDSFMNTAPKTDFGRLLQEIVRVEKENHT
ncbi:hypothetical protein Poli38472_005568 [Pythium oligandrum]|uniref:Uncharacterized protein n=1 Tax=Pythium oligandrum TaxID=41045 RepID=A0A8K1CGS2_PYTOL|nr:hypothetical protein Poli38472_005568 [Pythium oligandrum]|eukprot:TMW62950.1 hypothetical protein Poli38472_005568 [Pythium oligandrum]